MSILAVVSACLLNFRGAGVSMPLLPSDTHPLATQIGDLLTVNQFIMYGLVIASLVLCIRFLFTNFPSHFTWIDYAALCITALACSQLQSFFWQSNTQMGALPASDVAQSMFNELFVEISNQLVAGGLMLVIVIRLCIAFIMLARLNKPFARGDRFVLLLDVVVGVSFFLGKSKPLLPFSLATQRSIDNLFHIIPPNILFSAALLAVALISFHWLGHSKSVGDRKVLQILFRIGLICICLQLVIPSLLFTLPALLALTLGVVVATV